MADLIVTKKNFGIQYRGAAPLILNATNAPWISKILKIYRPSTGTALAVQSYAGSFNGATAGGAVTQLTPGYCYQIVAAVYDGSLVIPDSVLVDLVTYGTTAPPNQLPTANATPAHTITLPLASLSIAGSGTDPDGTISAYSWVQASGPNTLTGLPANTATINVGGFVAGVYQLDLTVTDNSGGTNTQRTSITVNDAVAANAHTLVVLVGDSKTAAYQVPNAATNTSSYKLAGLLAPYPLYVVGANLGTTGKTLAEAVAGNGTDVKALYDSTKHNKVKVFVDFAINDIGKNATTPAQLASLYTQYCALFPKPLYEVYIQTCWATNWHVSQPSTLTSAQIQSYVNGFNALARTDAASVWGAAGIMDDARDVRTQNPINLQFLQEDELHPTAAGEQVTADNIFNFLINNAQPPGSALTDATPTPNGVLFNELFTAVNSPMKSNGWLITRFAAGSVLATMPGDGALHFNGQDGDIVWQGLHGLQVGLSYRIKVNITAISGGTLNFKSEFDTALINTSASVAGVKYIDFTPATAAESLQIISSGPTQATISEVSVTIVAAPAAGPVILVNPSFDTAGTNKTDQWGIYRFATGAAMSTIPGDGQLHLSQQDDIAWQTLKNLALSTTYRMKVVVSSLSAGGSFHIASEFNSGLPTPTISAVGTTTYDFTLTQTTEGIQVIAGPGTAVVDEISIVKL